VTRQNQAVRISDMIPDDEVQHMHAQVNRFIVAEVKRRQYAPEDIDAFFNDLKKAYKSETLRDHSVSDLWIDLYVVHPPKRLLHEYDYVSAFNLARRYVAVDRDRYTIAEPSHGVFVVEYRVKM